MKISLNQAYSFTQLGHRANQEDARYPDCDTPQGEQHFFVVCDGVGGSEKGEVASRTVCDAFGKALEDFDWSRPFTTHDFERALDFAFSELERISTPENRGMATTLTFAAFHAGGCFIAHIGDSRVYYVRPSQGIVYRTDDHSLVNALVRAGVITAEEAETHPDRNVITRSVCVPEADQERSSATVVNIDDVRPGDYVFLCSDGVLKRLTDKALTDCLSQPGSDATKCANIAAMSVDSDDNNTAYLVSVAAVAGKSPVASTAMEKSSQPVVKPVETQAIKRKSSKNWLIVLALVVVVAAVAVFVLLKMLNKEDPVEETTSINEEITKIEESKAQRPHFVGDLQKFIQTNLRYPAASKKEGTVRLSFTVEEDGTTSHIVVKKGVEPAIDKEAVRLCSLMHFTPATDDDGEPTEATYEQEITFRRATVQQTQPAQPVVKKDAKKDNEKQPTAIEAAAMRSLLPQDEGTGQSAKTKTK